MDKKRKYRLQNQQPAESAAFGLVSDEPGYRISWLLNQHLGIRLNRVEDWILTIRNSSVDQHFVVYEVPADGETRIRLVQNRSEEGIWLTDYKQVNYLILLSCQSDPGRTEDLFVRIGQMPTGVRGLFRLELSRLAHLPV